MEQNISRSIKTALIIVAFSIASELLQMGLIKINATC